jgi:Protein of unknown function with PCYCGC motif
MKTRILFAVIAILAFVGAGPMLMRPGDSHVHEESAATSASRPAATHAHARVPAYQEPSQLGTLSPTLPAAQFFGKAREAYQVAKVIPATLAQLPCYCECDRGYGHKSLHSCFIDDHASHCAVCVDEALLAYKLQQEEKLTPDQVRARIIEKYSAQ